MVRKEAHVYLWHGCKSSSDSRKTAKVAAEKVQERYLLSMFIVVVNINICGINLKPGGRMRMMYYSVSNTGIIGKRKSECSYQVSRTSCILAGI